MSSFSLLRSSCGGISRVGSCSSSVQGARCLSSSSAVQGMKERQVAKVKGPPVQKQRGPRNRRRNVHYQFDKTKIAEIIQEPLSFGKIPRFPPQNLAGYEQLTRDNSIGKLHLNSVINQSDWWGQFTNQSADIRPLTVPRALTFDLMDRLLAIKDCPPDKKAEKHANLILWGNSGSGKTHLLAQTHAFAYDQGFITILIPSAIRHVSWNYPYHYSAKTQTFHQPTLACFLLNRINGGENARWLRKLPVDKPYTFSPDVAPGVGGSKKPVDLHFKGNNIGALCSFGAKEPSVSTEVLEIVMEAIRTQDKYPVLLTIDHAQAYFRVSNYITPELNKLESYHLSVPRMFLDIISGRKQLTRGLTLLAACPLDTAYRVTPELLMGLGMPTNKNVLGEYQTFSVKNYPMDVNKQIQPFHVENASDLEVIHVPEGLTLKEARGLWEAKAANRTMHTVNSDDNFLAKYIEVQGNPREFFRAIDISTQ